MSNEIYTGDSGLGAALLGGAVARNIAYEKLGDRNSIRNHPALVNLSAPLKGGATRKTALHGFGLDAMASRTEIQAIANTAPGFGSFTVTPGRYGLRYETSEWLRGLDPTMATDPAFVASWMPVSYGITLTTEIAKIGDDLTNVGTTTVDFSHDTWLLGQGALEAALVPGPYLAILSPNSFRDWQRDLEQRGGVTQWVPATQAMQMLRGPGYKGMYNGVDVFTSNYVQTINSAADDANFIFGRGCFGFEEIPMAPAPPSADVVLDLGFLRAYSAFAETTGLGSVTATAHFGVITMESSRGRAFSGAV